MRGTLSHEKLSVFKEVWLAAATSCANCRISEFYAFDRGSEMNKESIFRQLEQRIAGRALTAEALGEFNAMAIADSLKQKRSIISHHLNNLHREQRVVKVNGRPVLFLPVTVLRDHHRPGGSARRIRLHSGAVRGSSG